MLTYNPDQKPKRKDRPWLLFIMTLIWISGSCFFHDPWEPYEPYVVAIVQNITTHHHSWFIPYISLSLPYFDLQPFYFWIFAIVIKIFGFTQIVNAVRLINALLIFATIVCMGLIGSNLKAFRSGRTVVMLLISTVGFINNTYQLSPHIIPLLGFTLYIYALQKINKLPGSAILLLVLGLSFISINFSAEYILIALFMLILLPLFSSNWRTKEYLIVTCGGTGLFALFFSLYLWKLSVVDYNFFRAWINHYTPIFSLSNIVYNLNFYSNMLLWYLVPSSFLMCWTIYCRRKNIFNDPTLQVCVLLLGLLIINALFATGASEVHIFPIIIPVILIAAVEVDSIRITIVSLFNWFSIAIFGIAGVVIGALYVALSFGVPKQLYQSAKNLAPNYVFNFNIWQFLLALLIFVIWVVMITRKHIRGREAISNWASGTTFVLIIFVSLCIPWFNSVLSFQKLVGDSVSYMRYQNTCIATSPGNHIQDALWYYYAGITLSPERDITATSCNQALIVVAKGDKPQMDNWHVVWHGDRAIDRISYYLMERN